MGKPMPPKRYRLGFLSSIILCALVLWSFLLFRMVSSSPSAPSAHSGPPPCAANERVLWAPQVVFPNSIGPSAIHINDDGRIAAAWQCSRDEAEAFAQVRSLTFEAWDHDVISPGIVDAAAHLAEWLEAPGRSYEGFSSGTQVSR